MKLNLEYLSMWLFLTHIFLGCQFKEVKLKWVPGVQNFLQGSPKLNLALLLLSSVFQRAPLTTWTIRHCLLPGLHAWKVCGLQYTPGPSGAAEGM